MDAETPTPEKKRGPKPLLNDEDVAVQVAKKRGNISAVARYFDVSRTTVLERIHQNPVLQNILKDSREGNLDTAESSLNRAVRKGEGWAVCFLLKTLGKSRGYIERSEHVVKQAENFDDSQLTDKQCSAIAEILESGDETPDQAAALGTSHGLGLGAAIPALVASDGNSGLSRDNQR